MISVLSGEIEEQILPPKKCMNCSAVLDGYVQRVSFMINPGTISCFAMCSVCSETALVVLVPIKNGATWVHVEPFGQGSQKDNVS